MIVTRRAGALQLVEQVEHGRVAGELAAGWGNADWATPTPGPAVGLAAARHDEGWRAWDGALLYDELERRPQHFLEIDVQDHVRLYRAGVQTVSLLDVYAGLLVGMHWTGLYRGRWSRPGAGTRLTGGAGAGELLDEVVEEEERRWIEARRRSWLGRETRSTFESRLWHNYDLLQVWDLLSLYLCVQPAEPSDDDGYPPVRWGPQLTGLVHGPERVVLPPVATAPGGAVHEITVSVAEAGVVVLQPFPFWGPFEVEVTSRHVPDRPASRDELRALLSGTRYTSSQWRLEPLPPRAAS